MEHVSKKENTPKEAYISELEAIEAMHAMQYKYGEPFVVYQCRVCHKSHIGHKMEIKEIEEVE